VDLRRIVVVATDGESGEPLLAALAAAGHAAERAASAEDVSETTRADIVVLDGAALDPAGLRFAYGALARRGVKAPCLVAMPHASVDDAVELMRLGAFSVVSLPTDAARLGFQVDQALRHVDLCRKNASLERSLETHERLAMIGKLAAGVAHELNNPLDGVMRFVSLAADGLPKDSPQVPYLLEARRGLRRMADIVRDLLQFSRNANLDATTEDAERLAKDAVAQATSGAKDRVISTAFEFPPVGLALPRGMFQVFANVAKNAVDAMPRGGTLSVAAQLASGRVLIRVSDTGTGIPEDIREHVFDPFFTTKEVGKGTGLGLPICQRIVERLGGTMTLESEVGHGTTVHIDVPARRPPAVQQRTRTEGPFATARTGEEHP
jgi:signal transduction histidine kinase